MKWRPATWVVAASIVTAGLVMPASSAEASPAVSVAAPSKSATVGTWNRVTERKRKRPGSRGRPCWTVWNNLYYLDFEWTAEEQSHCRVKPRTVLVDRSWGGRATGVSPFRHLRWRGWGHAKATAAGSYRDCSSMGMSRCITRRVTIRLRGLRHIGCHGEGAYHNPVAFYQGWHYLRVAVNYGNGRGYLRSDFTWYPHYPSAGCNPE